jgi:hypothetical protein
MAACVPRDVIGGGSVSEQTTEAKPVIQTAQETRGFSRSMMGLGSRGSFF